MSYERRKRKLRATEIRGARCAASGSQFHVRELFDIKWAAVAGVQYYRLEGDDDPNFSAPQTLNVDAMQFGTSFHAGWGNSIPNIDYRVRAVGRQRPRAAVGDAERESGQHRAGAAADGASVHHDHQLTMHLVRSSVRRAPHAGRGAFSIGRLPVTMRCAARVADR
jgi:hypothetical protein